jgi:uncharacterized membrane protein
MQGFGEARHRRLTILTGVLVAIVFAMYFVHRLQWAAGARYSPGALIVNGIGALLLLVGGIAWVVMLVRMIRLDVREHERNMADMERRRRDLQDRR